MDHLRRLVRSFDSCLIAYSGGVDSAFLATVCHQELGNRALAVMADSPSLPRREMEQAIALARRMGFALRILRTREFDNPDYVANPINRCFHCKHELFAKLAPLAQTEGFAVVAYGENASDVGDHRPGAQAAHAFQVRSPLKETGLTKSEIRQLSRALNLPTADKPQMACLSSRIPHGQSVTPEKLAMVEQAENVLRDMGFHDVRVRHHELPTPGSGEKLPALARIELGSNEMERIWRENLGPVTAEKLQAIGYKFVTLDLKGYQRGSLNPAKGVEAAIADVANPVATEF